MRPCTTSTARALAVAAGTLAATAVARRRMLRWGATDAELRLALPGDEVLHRADLVATRAVTINAEPAKVWPWIAQLGQGRGGFYTYDRLENLVGADIHSADRIVPEWQQVEIGDEVNLAPGVALKVDHVDPAGSLVLHGAVPMGQMLAPYDFTWAFVLRDAPHGSTRLLVRERYCYLRAWAPLMVEPTEVISFVMSQRMLRGIKQRAEITSISLAAEHAGAPR